MPIPAVNGAMLPARHDIQAAVQGQRALAACLLSDKTTQRIQILDQHKQPQPFELPTVALRLLADILAELAEGNAVKVVSVHSELTTQEAADLLKVSRPHLVKLLETGALPFYRTGKHRRVRLADLLQFKQARERESEAAMAELTRLSQELSLGYE